MKSKRVLLSILPGSSVISVKIEGVMHEFQKIDGVIEDVTAIVLNLKSIVIKNNSDALTLTYTPGSSATSYDVIENYKSEEYNDNLKVLGGVVWPVWDEDFSEMMNIGFFSY